MGDFILRGFFGGFYSQGIFGEFYPPNSFFVGILSTGYFFLDPYILLLVM